MRKTIPPPPLIYIAWGFAAVVIHRFWPFTLLPENGYPEVLSGLALIAGVICTLSGFMTFWNQRISFEPNAAATSLLTNGAFRFSRNPIYLGFAIIFAAAILKSNNGWMLLCFPFLIATMNVWVIAKEEEKLLAAFGTEYEIYCKKVRRWI